MAQQGRPTDWLQVFFNGVTTIADDVRHKVVESGWFQWSNGQETTGDTPRRDEFYGNAPSWSQVDKPWEGRRDTSDDLGYDLRHGPADAKLGTIHQFERNEPIGDSWESDWAREQRQEQDIER